MNSYQNKKRKRNLAKKEKFKKTGAYRDFIDYKKLNVAFNEAQFNFIFDKLFPKAFEEAFIYNQVSITKEDVQFWVDNFTEGRYQEWLNKK